jgi:hypothetical protein
MIHMKYDPSSISRADSITLSALLLEVLTEERDPAAGTNREDANVGDNTACLAFETPRATRRSRERGKRISGGHPADINHEAVA